MIKRQMKVGWLSAKTNRLWREFNWPKRNLGKPWQSYTATFFYVSNRGEDGVLMQLLRELLFVSFEAAIISQINGCGKKNHKI